MVVIPTEIPLVITSAQYMDATLFLPLVLHGAGTYKTLYNYKSAKDNVQYSTLCTHLT